MQAAETEDEAVVVKLVFAAVAEARSFCSGIGVAANAEEIQKTK